MLYLPFQFFYAVISLQLEVGPIIICLVVCGVSGIEDKLVDVVGLENICGPIIELSVMAIKEEDLLIDLDSSTSTTEETHCLHLAIHVHIS